jgi:Txe/YoeB family toxin of toxin-antitoxin system
MVRWKLVYTKIAQKDAEKLRAAGLKAKVIEILKILDTDPFQVPPLHEKLTGDLSGAYSGRINILHRIVYQVLKEEKTIKIIRMGTYYG